MVDYPRWLARSAHLAWTAATHRGSTSAWGLLRRHPEDLGLSPDGASSSPMLPSGEPLPGLTLAQALHRPTFWLLTVSLALVMLGSTVVQCTQIPALIGRGYDPVLAASIAGGLGFGKSSWSICF